MKKYQYIFVRALMIILVCMATSCGNNEPDEQPDDVIKIGECLERVPDGSLLNGIELTIPGLWTFKTVSVNGVNTHTYYLDNFSNIVFNFSFNQENYLQYLKQSIQPAHFESIFTNSAQYEKSKLSLIENDSKEFISKNPETEAAINTFFYFAYVDGTPAITCDKKLFGLEPGTNLSKYFEVFIDENHHICCIPQGIENPNLLYKFGDELPKVMNEYFSDKSWISDMYYIRLIDKPTEEYDELTFHLSFPLIVEHTTDYVIEQFKGGKPERKFSKRVLEADCHIVFNRE